METPPMTMREDHRRGGGAVNGGGQQHGGHHGDHVGLIQVSGHTGAVTHVVADVVSDNRGVAGVVFGDAGFDLTYQVSAHVRRFGVDAAAQPGEDAHQGATEAQTDQGVHGMLREQPSARTCSSRPRSTGPGLPPTCR